MQIEPKNEEVIFKAAIQLKTRAERDAYILKTCGDDQELLTRVRGLLKHHDSSSFLDAPIFEPDIIFDESPISEGPGTVIGRYKLLEKIGEGGMAVVYMAEQEKPIRRKVALKIIKLGMDTKQVIARFEAERQALAMMDHPNIAKVLDAGATETGRPYFVMELVTGVSITEYCDKNNLSTKERLTLFIQVCNAVQHAHQKGIIHRDIKPSNVMVTHHDDRAVPKIIDFGIVKAINQRLTEKTLFTRYAHIIGTPAYMSPEQAQLNDLDIDTRSDIYSLGVLLYELLTGTTPFSEEELRKAGYIEMQRVIKEQEPLKPSTKLSTLGQTLTDIAKHHSSTPDLLTKSIRGDLDWIVMKALEKVRDRRYETVSALAVDVQHHLKDEPILARPPSTIYHLHKFLHRHRSQALTALVTFAITIPLIVMLSIWKLEQRKLDIERDKKALNSADYEFNARNLDSAMVYIKPILTSKYVGTEARLLYDKILMKARENVNNLNNRIEADSEDAESYFLRAKNYQILGERDKVNADMQQWSTILSQAWSSDIECGTPENLGPTINTSLPEVNPKMNVDGLQLCFHIDGTGVVRGAWLTNRPTKIHPWDPPVPLTSSKSAIFVPSKTTLDGLEFYTHNWSAEYGSSDIYVMTRKTINNDFGPLENLGDVVNSPAAEMCPAISSDGLELYFSELNSELARPGGYGNTDLWVTRRITRNDPWEEPKNLGNIVNTEYREARPSLSANGLLLFFDSVRPGGYGNSDIWVSRRKTKDDPWEKPINLGPVINTPASELWPHLSADGSTLLYSSNRPGGYGAQDIWQVSIIIPGYEFDPNNIIDIVNKPRASDLGKEVLSSQENR